MSPSSRRPDPTPSLERLQKVLAAAGIGSRRECETLIEEGRVEVDGQTVTELGVRVDPTSQDVRVDGERIRVGRREYYAFYKPTGVLCTSADPEGRLRVIDLIPSSNRVFTVGRLDRSSEGLIVVTNDGPLAQRLTHPSYGIEKTYDVLVMGHPDWDHLRSLLDGVRLAEGWAKAKHLEIRQRFKDNTLVRIVLDEGRNREVRRLLARIGHKVIRLKRIAIGGLWLGNLQPGESRRLSNEEIALLEQAAPSDRGSSKFAVRPRSSRPSPREREAPGAAGRSGSTRDNRSPEFTRARPTSRGMTPGPGKRQAPESSRPPARASRPPGRTAREPQDRWESGRPRRENGDAFRPEGRSRQQPEQGRGANRPGDRPARPLANRPTERRPAPSADDSGEGRPRGTKPLKRRGRPLAGKVKKKSTPKDSRDSDTKPTRTPRPGRPQVRPTRVPKAGPRGGSRGSTRPTRPEEGERDPRGRGHSARPMQRGPRPGPADHGGGRGRPQNRPRPNGRRPFGPADLPEGD